MKGALELSIRFPGETDLVLGHGRTRAVRTFNSFESTTPNAPALRLQSKAPLTNYPCKMPASIKELWVEIHIIKETSCSPKAKKKKSLLRNKTKQSVPYFT